MVKQVTISLPDDLVARVKAQCWKQGVTFSGLIRAHLESIIEKEHFKDIKNNLQEGELDAHRPINSSRNRAE